MDSLYRVTFELAKLVSCIKYCMGTENEETINYLGEVKEKFV